MRGKRANGYQRGEDMVRIQPSRIFTKRLRTKLLIKVKGSTLVGPLPPTLPGKIAVCHDIAKN